MQYFDFNYEQGIMEQWQVDQLKIMIFTEGRNTSIVF